MAVTPLMYSSNLHSLAFWVSFGAWMAMEVWVWTRERGVKGENRDRGSRTWVVALIWVGVYLAFSLMYAAPGATMHRAAEALFWAGVALIWLGVALRFWAIRTLGRFFNTSVIIQGGHRVISDGPYRIVRNPSYSGALLSFLGVGLALSNWASLAVIVLFSLAGYWRRIKVEQGALVEHFGQEYRDYITRTWALIPFVW